MRKRYLSGSTSTSKLDTYQAAQYYCKTFLFQVFCPSTREHLNMCFPSNNPAFESCLLGSNLETANQTPQQWCCWANSSSFHHTIGGCYTHTVPKYFHHIQEDHDHDFPVTVLVASNASFFGVSLQRSAEICCCSRSAEVGVSSSKFHDAFFVSVSMRCPAGHCYSQGCPAWQLHGLRLRNGWVVLQKYG